MNAPAGDLPNAQRSPPGKPGSSQQLPADTDAEATQTFRDGATGRIASSFPSQFGDYQLVERIAQGGMGVVYKARQQSLNRIVALKMMLAGEHADQELIQRFHSEAQAAARLQHPNIVAIHEVGQHDGQHFFSMDYIEGSNLSARARERPLADRDAAHIVMQIAVAVDSAHQMGVLHRDLKPSNVLVDADGKPWVTDFGLAKQVDHASELTCTGQILGTPSYMPPEQALGETQRIGPASDVYALGAILYFLATGRPPFQAASAVATLKQVVDRDPLPPRQINPDIRRDLETITLKCLQKEPRRRYATAQSLADDLSRYLNDEPIHARPAGLLERFVKWSRRRPARAALLAVVAISLPTLLVLLGLTLRYSARLEKALIDEGKARHEVEQQQIETQSALAQNLFDQGQDLCANGQTIDGLFWMARALENVPPGAVRLERLIRANLAHWENELPRLIGAVETLTVPETSRFVQAPVAVADDGRTLVQLVDENSAQLFDIATGQPLGPRLVHAGGILSVAISPNGQRVVTAGQDMHARLWNARVGKLLGTTSTHQAGVFHVVFSPDGSKFMTFGDVDTATPGTHFARIFGGTTAEPTGAPLPWKGKLIAASFSPDGELARIVSLTAAVPETPEQASADTLVSVWQAATGALVGQPIQPEPQPGPLTSYGAVSADGRFVLATDSIDGSGYFVDLATREQTGNRMVLGDKISLEAVAPRGALVALAGTHRMFRLWNAATQDPVGPTMTMPDPIEHIAFSASGRFLVVVSATEVRVWDSQLGRPHQVLPHPLMVFDATFAPDEQTLFTGSIFVAPDRRSGFGAVYRWNPATGEQIGPPLQHGRIVTQVECLPDQTTLLTAARGEEDVRFWEIPTGQRQSKTIRLPRGISPAKMALSQLGERVAILSGHTDVNYEAIVWDTHTGQPAGQPLRHDEFIEAVALSPDGQIAATASDDDTARLWNVETGQPLGGPLEHDDDVLCLAFAPDGKRLLTGSADQTARLWNVHQGNQIGEPLQHESAVLHVAITADGQRMVTATQQGTARFWSLESRQRLGRAMQHDGQINTFAFSPDATLLLTGSNDQTVRIWDLETGSPLGLAIRHAAPVSAVRCSHSGRLLVTASHDRTARVYEIPEPLSGSPPEIIRRLEAQTAMRLDGQQQLHTLDRHQWAARCALMASQAQ